MQHSVGMSDEEQAFLMMLLGPQRKKRNFEHLATPEKIAGWIHSPDLGWFCVR